ncbi:MAG: L-fucose:H+ symporter permease [Verrucomicrobia bacterium]|nr:L-fucose:H+ symporter permease [Verrucomicrobiota bacterium]
MDNDKSKGKDYSNAHRLIPQGEVFAFILLTSCFLWWGIANNMTDPLVKVFEEIFQGLSTFQSSLVQFAFYGGYFCLAIPGAIIARKFSYKTGVLVGLGLYAFGCFLLFPASLIREFIFFLIAYYVLASGLSILETNANPYVLSLGSEETSTQRLNLAQAFNPIGSVIGILLCRGLIMAKLPTENNKISIPDSKQAEALAIVIFPYIAVAVVLLIVWLLILFTKMPRVSEPDKKVHFGSTFKRLSKNPNYVFAVIAQFFYVGVQITTWTYTNYYIPDELGVPQEVALKYHTGALILFFISRFIATWLMSYIKEHKLLMYAGILAAILTCNVIFIGGYVGVYSLVGISGCMSLMFPTIFGLGSRGLGHDKKVGGSGLIMAIVGGAILTPLQGAIIDWSNVNISYFVPFASFLVIIGYAIYAGTYKPEVTDNSAAKV